jgi:hypothetical protein
MNNEPITTTGHIAATFTLNGHHKVIVHHTMNDRLFATCMTCALSQTVARAAVFATENQIYRITIDGAELSR